MLQSLAFIAGYSVHQILKCRPTCRVCRDVLTIDRDLLVDEPDTISQFKLLELSDRGGLKYPSDVVLESIVTAWKIFIFIEDDSKLMEMFVKVPSRKIFVDLSMNVILDVGDCQLWRDQCSYCSISGFHVLQKLLFVAGNCLLANKVKNYNSLIILKGFEKRKLKNFY